MNFILGASGLIGTAMTNLIEKKELTFVPKNEYMSWSSPENLRCFVEKMSITEQDTFYVCAGITNPNAELTQLILLNTQIPLILLEQSIYSRFKVVTFGTFHENFNFNNQYIMSKKKFLRNALNLNGNLNHRHFQLHTAYGIHEPKVHLLLGKIYWAIKNNVPLQMSRGTQFREYWHAIDIARFVKSRNWDENCARITSVSSGEPIQLRELALAIFDHFSAHNLLNLASIPDQSNETYNKGMFQQTDNAAGFMRDPIRGVLDYLENHLNGGVYAK